MDDFCALKALNHKFKDFWHLPILTQINLFKLIWIIQLIERASFGWLVGFHTVLDTWNYCKWFLPTNSSISINLVTEEFVPNLVTATNWFEFKKITFRINKQLHSIALANYNHIKSSVWQSNLFHCLEFGSIKYGSSLFKLYRLNQWNTLAQNPNEKLDSHKIWSVHRIAKILWL